MKYMYGTFICVDCGKEVQRQGSKQIRCPECQRWHKVRMTSERRHMNYMKKKGEEMLVLREGNLVSGKFKIFCQQVNCKGVMGAGLAKEIKEKYPEVYREYKFGCMYHDNLLGTIQPVETHDGSVCVNMFAQDGYGRDKRYTDYSAFRKCLNKIKVLLEEQHLDPNAEIAFPYGIGCGLAGGDWNRIREMLREFAEEIPNKVVLVKKV